MPRATYQGAPAQPSSQQPQALHNHARQVAAVANNMLGGALNVVADIALENNSTTTTIADSRIAAQSWLGLDPLTPAAAALLATGTLYAPENNRAQGRVILAHPAATTDRRFRLLILG